MKKTTYYCDYCGKETKELKKIETPWWYQLLSFIGFISNNFPQLKGEGCMDCFDSYKKWVKSRKVRK